MTSIEDRSTNPAPAQRRWVPLALAVGSLLAVPLVGGVMRLLRATLDPVSVNASGPSPGMLGVAASLLLAAAGLAVGIRALRASARTWLVWLGTLACGAITLLWVAFVLGEILAPH